MTLEERLSRIEEHLKLEEKQIEYRRDPDTRKVVRIYYPTPLASKKAAMELIYGEAMPSYRDVVGCWDKIPHTVHDGQELWDGCLVECWDDKNPGVRQTSFFDAKTDTVFGVVDGQKYMPSHDHYKLISYDKWPDWAHEAYKRLEL